ncbi:hypothetical protein HPB48_012848 [Haemaphysalis longicornis]|uniref:RNase H type-1 domain-containing protein n=1 Tax=Haemaphysalis longicornis TaxID=44386 RepID=A0A9J6FSC1_HAELO|nr:hypothetical protein HPB48_012848 [Haemaphysalis longicornis]
MRHCPSHTTDNGLRNPMGTIVTDSQEAYRSISNGLGSPHTLAVFRTISDIHPLPQINLVWAPAHAGMEGNDAAHD